MPDAARRVIRPVLALILAGTGIALTAEPASASSAAVVAQELLISADPGEANHITVELLGNEFIVSDTAGIDAGAGCTQEDPNRITCKRKGVVLVVIDAEDGNDVVRVGGVSAFIQTRGGNDRVVTGSGDDKVRGGGGADRLKTGDGEDTLRGGGGDDILRARDGEADRVSGGGGTDEAFVDQEDRVSKVELFPGDE
jgi:Ca2+-binding RTX toxin-like protein